MKILLGFNTNNYKGEYQIDGTSVENIDIDDFRSQINYLLIQ